jgi:hypothetical protein
MAIDVVDFQDGAFQVYAQLRERARFRKPELDLTSLGFPGWGPQDLAIVLLRAAAGLRI